MSNYIPNSTSTTGSSINYTRSNTTSTGDNENISHVVSVNSRELAQTRMAADAAQVIAINLERKMEILEVKFSKVIEILTARGINIMELI